MAAERDWVSAHIFYHGDLDEVLVHSVHPLARQLTAAGLVDGCFFLRYWDGGPHVRLRLSAQAHRHDTVRERVEQQCAELFRQRPAPDRHDPRDYPAWAARLAALEGVRDHRRHPYPNNSLVFLPYHREHHRYGDGEAMAAVERHFVESSMIALGLVAGRLADGQRRLAAFAMLLLAWSCATPPAAAVSQLRPAGPVSVDDEAAYQRQRDTLHHVARWVRALPAGAPSGRAGALAAWSASMIRLRDTLTVGGTGTADRARIIDLCAHLGCNRLGLAADSERRLRYLAARTIGEMTEPGTVTGTATTGRRG